MAPPATGVPPVPYRLLRHHGAMFKASGRIVLHTILRAFRPPTSRAPVAAISRTIPAPPE